MKNCWKSSGLKLRAILSHRVWGAGVWPAPGSSWLSRGVARAQAHPEAGCGRGGQLPAVPQGYWPVGGRCFLMVPDLRARV